MLILVWRGFCTSYVSGLCMVQATLLSRRVESVPCPLRFQVVLTYHLHRPDLFQQYSVGWRIYARWLWGPLRGGDFSLQG